jgi:hypothetical protein
MTKDFEKFSLYDETLPPATTSMGTSGYCTGGHTWFYGGDIVGEGTPCNCGQYLSHYEICKTCGTRHFSPQINPNHWTTQLAK